MTVAQIIVGILMIVFSIAIIAIILLQQGRRKGIGVVSGGVDSFLSKNKARTADAILSRITKYVAIAFFALTVVANIIAFM